MARLMQAKAQEAMRILHDGARIEVIDEKIEQSIQDAANKGEIAPLENEESPGSDVEDNHSSMTGKRGTRLS